MMPLQPSAEQFGSAGCVSAPMKWNEISTGVAVPEIVANRDNGVMPLSGPGEA